MIVSPSAVVNSPSAPWWYLTSPVPPCGIAATRFTRSSAWAPSNSAMIDSAERPRLWVSTSRRPRCAMPITTSSAPPRLAMVTSSSIIGTTASRPSIENIFWPEIRALQEALELEDVDQPR